MYERQCADIEQHLIDYGHNCYDEDEFTDLWQRHGYAAWEGFEHRRGEVEVREQVQYQGELAFCQYYRISP